MILSSTLSSHRMKSSSLLGTVLTVETRITMRCESFEFSLVSVYASAELQQLLLWVGTSHTSCGVMMDSLSRSAPKPLSWFETLRRRISISSRMRKGRRRNCNLRTLPPFNGPRRTTFWQCGHLKKTITQQGWSLWRSHQERNLLLVLGHR